MDTRNPTIEPNGEGQRYTQDTADVTPAHRPADANPTIVPVDFDPSSETVKSRFSVWQILLGIVLAAVAAVFWFLFTSKSVQVNFNPNADRVSVSGGISFELGGVFLLREGEYVIEADAPLHEPLSTTVQVGQERNQYVELDFTPLPGFLAIETEPHDAQIMVDGQVVEDNPVELAAGTHQVSVNHPRYLPTSEAVHVEGKQIQQEAHFELAPNWAEVDLVSDPPGATIFIDEEDTTLRTPATIEALAGEREIRVSLDGYKSHRERIFAQAGDSMTLDPVKLIQADATLKVTSQPTGAGITINGRFVGQTPLTLDLRSGSNQRLQVIKSGYATFQRDLRLSRGDSRQLHAKLTQQLGKINITMVPQTAQLRVNGKSIGTGNRTLSLPISPHDISITLPGYAGFSQSITPRVGLTQEIKVKLLTLEEARLLALTPTVTTAAGQNLRLFEPFAFNMGASRREPGRRANETLRQADMNRLFYLATHEVTNAQFREFATGHDSSAYVEATLNDDDQPVVNLSWHDAAAYCNWLSERDELPLYYVMEFAKVVGTNANATGYRLPTEAEWEWAARTGAQAGAEQLRFPWGPALPPPDRHGNYADRSANHLVGRIIFGYNDNYASAAPVGTYKANHRGLYDMGGNVSEWINDYYEIPSADAVTNPTGPRNGEYRVIKGSSWMHGTITELRYSFRDYGIDARPDVGFRIARYAE